MRFARARVLITGGASGIGAHVAGRFLAEGARVAIIDASEPAVADFAAAHPDAHALCADVADPTALAGATDVLDRDWGGVDIACAFAGTGGPAGRIEDLDPADWAQCLSVNLGGAFLTAQWAARHMRPAGRGVILLMSSTAGLFAYPGRAPYATAKAGIVALMKSLASDLGPDGVRVNAIAPGAVDGPRMEHVVAMEAQARGVAPDVIRRLYAEGTALKTWVTPDDVAETTLFLASDAAARISGQVLAVDGHTETLS